MWAFLLALSAVSQRHQGGDCNTNTRLSHHFPTPVYLIAKLSQNGRRIVGTTCSDEVFENCYLDVLDAISGATLSRTLLNRRVDNLLVAPNGERIFFQGSGWQGWIVELGQMTWTPVLTYRLVAWSPDSLTLIGRVGKTWMLFNATNGASLKNWTQDIDFGFVCWSPGHMISVWSPPNLLTRFHPNGTRASVVQVPNARTELSCSPNSDVAYGNEREIVVVDLAGNITQQLQEKTLQVALWDAKGRWLITFTRTFSVYDTSLQRLLEVTENADQKPIGFLPDETTLTLVTLSADGANFWNVQPPQIRTFDKPYRPLGWIDRDRVLIKEFNVNSEFNVRTGTTGFTYEIPSTFEPSCLMGGKFYRLRENGTISVFARGQQLRSWNTGLISTITRQISCSHNQIAISSEGDNRLLVWNHLGALVQDQTFSVEFSHVTFYNSSRFVLCTNVTCWMWNPQTCQPDPFLNFSIFANRPYMMKWSPDGSWLVFQGRTKALNSWIVYQSDGRFLMQTESTVEVDFVGQQADWSWDSNWLLVRGPPALLVAPKLNKSYSAGKMLWDEAFWNPETMEVFAFLEPNQEPSFLWIPSPVELKLVGSTNKVGVPSSTTVSLVGGSLLPPTTKAMIRWVDSSSAVPQCMLLNATQVDAYTLSLGDITFSDPAQYTVYIQHPNDNPTSPWLGSDALLTISCGEFALPNISMEGGLTTCVCVHDRYGEFNHPNSGLKCLLCPRHGRCNGSPSVVSEKGYWPRTGTDFLPCSPGACIGNNACSEYHEGPVCGLCKPGCGQYGFGRCRNCNQLWVDVLLLICGLLLWVVFCAIQSLFALGWRNNKGRSNNSAQLAAVLVSTAQALALLLSVDVNLNSFSNVLGLTEGGGVQSAVLSCIFISAGWSPSEVHYIKQVAMLLLPLVGWAILVCMRTCLLRCFNVITSVNVVRVPAMVLWASLQSAIVTSLLQTFQCTHINAQGFNDRLSHDLSVACYDKTYWMFVGLVTIPALFVNAIFIPAMIMWLLQFRPQESRSGHLKFLVKNYRTHWWYMVIFYRKVLLSAVVTFTKNPLYVALTLLVSAILHIIVWPSTALVVNASETISLTTTAFIFAATAALDSDGEAYEYSPTVLIFVGTISYAVQITLLISDRRQSTQEKGPQVVLQHIQESDPIYTRLLDQ